MQLILSTDIIGLCNQLVILLRSNRKGGNQELVTLSSSNQEVFIQIIFFISKKYEAVFCLQTSLYRLYQLWIIFAVSSPYKKKTSILFFGNLKSKNQFAIPSWYSTAFLILNHVFYFIFTFFELAMINRNIFLENCDQTSNRVSFLFHTLQYVTAKIILYT